MSTLREEEPLLGVRAAADSSDWLRARAAIYHVYVRSFQDSTGSGAGDLAGVLERLPHIVSLGADAPLAVALLRLAHGRSGLRHRRSLRRRSAVRHAGRFRRTRLGPRMGRV